MAVIQKGELLPVGTRRDWIIISIILSVSFFVRMLFFTGFSGSDEITYTKMAVDIVNGSWVSPNYIGAARYGINIPVAFFIKVFGLSEFSANFWCLLTSLGEIFVVFWLARSIWGEAAAIYSSAILSFLPIHVQYAGALMADPPLAFFITLSFAFFYISERTNLSKWYFLTGISMGVVFWIKEVVAPIFLFAFVFYALVLMRWNKKWMWVIAGGMVMVFGNLILNWGLTSNPFHTIDMLTGVHEKYSSPLSASNTSPIYYLEYLLFDIKHTWLLGIASLGGLLVPVVDHFKNKGQSEGTKFVVLWAFGLIFVFSFFVISINPFKLVAKQPNYMLIFVAPLCLLSGNGLSRIPSSLAIISLIIILTGSFLLSGMEQQVIRSFTANSKAALKFAEKHSEKPIWGQTLAVRMAQYAQAIGCQKDILIKPITELYGNESGEHIHGTHKNVPSKGEYMILDHESLGWGRHPFKNLAILEQDWVRIEKIEPIDFGAGQKVCIILKEIVEILPTAIAAPISRRIDALISPKPAYVYEKK